MGERAFYATAALLAAAVMLGSAVPGLAATGEIPTQAVERDGRLVAGDGWLERRDGITVVHLRGTRRQIGAQSYLLMAKEAEHLRALVDPSVRTYRGWARIEWAFQDFYMRQKLAPSLLRHTPQEFVEEMEGFVEAASQGTDDDILSVLLGSVFQDISTVYGCTAFAAFGPATADGRLLHGRNLDALSMRELRQYAVVAIYEPQGAYPFITVTYPANIGVMHGMNVHGISVSMNYSFATPENTTLDGMAFMFLVRHVLERATTLDEAVELVRTAPRTVGLNILVADGKIPDARVVEVAADRYQVRRPDDGAIWATNRYETPFMRAIQSPGWLASERRDARLRELLGRERGRLDVPGAVAVLRDRGGDRGSAAERSVVGGIDNAGTIASMVFDPARLVVWVGLGADEGTAADGRYVAFDLRQELARASAGEGAASIVSQRAVIPAVERSTPESRAWEAVVKAQYFESIGRHDDVRALVEPVVERFPEAEQALMLLGRDYANRGMRDEAERCFRKVVASASWVEPRNRVEAFVWLGRMAERRGDPQEAVALYDAALEVPLTDVSGDDTFRTLARRRLQVLSGEAADHGLEPLAMAGLPSSEMEPGTRVGSVTVVGRAATSRSLVESRLALQAGDALSEDALDLTLKRLMQLGAFESVRITPVPASAGDTSGKGADVIVRLHEGFGWYQDPVGLVAMTGAQLLLAGELRLAYANLGGVGINLEGWYRLRSSPGAYGLSVEVPSPPALGAVVPPFEARLSWARAPGTVRATQGARAGLSRVVESIQVNGAAETVWTPALTTTVGLGWRDERWSDTLGAAAAGSGWARWAAGSLGVSWDTVDVPAWPRSGQRLAVSTLCTVPLGGERSGEAEPGETPAPFGRVEAQAQATMPLGSSGRWVGSVKVAGGWLSEATPFHRRFVPGSGTGLRVAAPALPSRTYARSSVDLSWEAIPSLRLGVFAEAGLFGEEGLAGPAGATGVTARAAGAGVFVRYLTPVGVSVGAHVATTPEGSITWAVGL